MSRLVRSLAALGLAVASLSCEAPASAMPEPDGPAETLAVVNAMVIPMSAAAPLPKHTIVVRNAAIVSVAPAAQAIVPPGARIIDARGGFVVPGLIDFHVHLRAESELERYVRHGVTTIVVLRATPTALEIRRRVEAGELQGPRILMSGPLIDGDPPIWSGTGTRVVRNTADARDAVKEQCRKQFDLVKTYNNLPADHLDPVVGAAHACGMPVVAHLPRVPVRTEGLVRALAAGVDVIAHAEEVFFTHLGGASDAAIDSQSRVDPNLIADAVGRIRRAGSAVVPNLSFSTMTARLLENSDSVFEELEFSRLDADVQAMWRAQNPARRRDLAAFVARERLKRPAIVQLTAALHRAGVPLFLGTDASAPGMFPGLSAHLELRELVAAGLSPYEALSTATRIPGRFLEARIRKAPRVGVISPGSSADLVLLSANPLEDVNAFASTRGVMVRGKWRTVDPQY